MTKETLEERARRHERHLVEGSTKEALTWAIAEIDRLRLHVKGAEFSEGCAMEDVSQFQSALADAQSENEVLREQIAEAWNAHGEVQRKNAEIALYSVEQIGLKDERIVELLREKNEVIGGLEAEVVRLRERIRELEQQLGDAKDDLLFYDDACRYCLMPEVEYAWRHDHDGDGRFHWHHRLDPGDGLVSDCAHSEMYEQVWQEAQAEKEQQLKAAPAEIESHRITSKALREIAADAQERLAEAEIPLVLYAADKNWQCRSCERSNDGAHRNNCDHDAWDGPGDGPSLAKEYFAKHSTEKERG